MSTLNLSVNEVFQAKKFADENVSIIPFIDPDSTRYAEWMWALQNARGGKDIYLKQYEIPDNFNVTLEELALEQRHRFPGICYFSKNYFRAIRENTEKNYPDLYMTITANNGKNCQISVIGEKHEVDEIITHYETKYRTPNSITIQNLKGFSEHGAIVNNVTLSEDKQELANNEFYPYIPELKNGIDKFIEEYMKSSSSILVLWGPWGTGKSAFLRTLLFRSGRKNIGLANNAVSLEHPSLISWLDEVGDEPIIGIEDADILVKARDTGNRQMSMLLNFAEGVIKNNNKLIISTNLTSLKDIDEALIRPGRAFKVLKFDLLSHEEANIARASIGKEPVDFTGKSKVSLAEALNWTEITNIDSHQRTTIGFAPAS